VQCSRPSVEMIYSVTQYICKLTNVKINRFLLYVLHLLSSAAGDVDIVAQIS